MVILFFATIRCEIHALLQSSLSFYLMSNQSKKNQNISKYYLFDY